METSEESSIQAEPELETTLNREQALEHYMARMLNRYDHTLRIMVQMTEEVRVVRRWLLIKLVVTLLLTSGIVYTITKANAKSIDDIIGHQQSIEDIIIYNQAMHTKTNVMLERCLADQGVDMLDFEKGGTGLEMGEE